MKKLLALLVVSAFLTSLISGCHSPTQTEISTTLTGTTPLTPTHDTWQTTNVGSANLAKITGLEIHADTWGYGFTMWVDGLCFEPYFLTTPSSTLAIITTPTTTSTSFFAVTTPTTPINTTTTTTITVAPPQPSTQVVLAEMFTGDW